MKKDRKPRFTQDGLPVDGREWLEDDWRDLHTAMEAAKSKIAARHKEPSSEPQKATEANRQGNQSHGA